MQAISKILNTQNLNGCYSQQSPLRTTPSTLSPPLGSPSNWWGYCSGWMGGCGLGGASGCRSFMSVLIAAKLELHRGDLVQDRPGCHQHPGGAGICNKNLLWGEARNGVKKCVCVFERRGVRSDVLSAVSICLHLSEWNTLTQCWLFNQFPLILLLDLDLLSRCLGIIILMADNQLLVWFF